MFGMSGIEIAVLFVLALLLLGPQKLPELARSIGKGIRDFRRATDGIRASVEDEFYNLDKPPAPKLNTVTVKPVAPRIEVDASSAAPADATAAAAATAVEAAVEGANRPPEPPESGSAAPADSAAPAEPAAATSSPEPSTAEATPAPDTEEKR